MSERHARRTTCRRSCARLLLAFPSTAASASSEAGCHTGKEQPDLHRCYPRPMCLSFTPQARFSVAKQRTGPANDHESEGGRGVGSAVRNFRTTFIKQDTRPASRSALS
ncbi:hypothetical protein K438DRAFT_1849945 [Mycena galopus ATCC 62051]|nr:hypothetical protein K438DRAFT_1849945 [Mycena galopus ATCC 62051]